MKRLVAVRRQSRSELNPEIQDLTVAQKRKEVAFDARSGPTDRERAVAAILEHDDSYKRFGNVHAYVLDIPTKDEKEDTKRVIDKFEDDYLIVPDFPVVVPQMPSQSKQKLFRHALSRYCTPMLDASGATLAREKKQLTGQGVLVGVIDTGIDTDHINFKKKTIPFFRREEINYSNRVRGFDTDGHGTHVAGIIAGSKTGIAPESELIVASAISGAPLPGGSGTLSSFSNVIMALDDVLSMVIQDGNEDKPLIINLSLGYPEDKLRQIIYETNEKDGLNVREQDALLAYRSALKSVADDYEALIVGAVGNRSGISESAPLIPAAFPEVLSVGAVGWDKKRPRWSLHGSAFATSQPDVVGYGVDVFSSYKRDWNGTSWYTHSSGTSMASAYVSAVSALYAQETGLHGEALKQHLIENVVPLDESGTGAGLVWHKQDD